MFYCFITIKKTTLILINLLIISCSSDDDGENTFTSSATIWNGATKTFTKSEGQNIIIKTNEGTRYYKLDWRDDYGTHGMPFNP
jgi:hypothetical protein